MQADTFLKELLFSTVRIVVDIAPNKQNVGTGFLVAKKISDTAQQIHLITNKHVIARTDEQGNVIGKFNRGYFSFAKNNEGNPILGNSIAVTIENITDNFFLHPDSDVDLAICNISNIYNHVTLNLKQEIFIRTIPLEMIPTGAEHFDAIEDVIFVGYPNGIFDEKNHLPIIRKGITASPYEVDFNGGKKFIIDAQVFPGSSGSPVFIKEQKMRDNALRIGPDSYFFIGVIARVFHRTETGKMTQAIVPASDFGEITMRQMIGLGICEKSSQILELIELINKKK